MWAMTGIGEKEILFLKWAPRHVDGVRLLEKQRNHHRSWIWG